MSSTPLTARFAYFGTPYVAADTLAALVAAGYVPAVVVTAPDAPRGRGMVLTPSETRVLAAAHGIPVLTPEKVTAEIIEELRTYACEYALCVAYGKMLPTTLIDIFPKGILNIHYSLLPKYRGASPVEAALLAGDTRTGVALQRMVPELDAGDIVASSEVPIEPSETTRELRPRLVALGSQLLIETLPAYLAGEITPAPQAAAGATICRKIKKEAGELTLAGDALENWNKYRAYAESPGTYFFIQKDSKQVRVKIKTATYDGLHFTPLRVVPEGKNEMDYEVFLKSVS